MKTYHLQSPLSDRQATRKLISQARHARRKTDGNSLADAVWGIAIVLIPLLGFLSVILMGE